MDLQLSNNLFIVTGATSGFGLAIAKTLLHEGGNVIINARDGKKLNDIKQLYPRQVQYVRGDITKGETIDSIISAIAGRTLSGIFVNSGGPPPLSLEDSTLEDWDMAYQSVLRWKIELTKKILPQFKKNKYGRMVFLESSSIKQPVPGLIFSNTYRTAMAGFVKTLSQEAAPEGITLNIIAPGYHSTQAVERIINNQSEKMNMSYDETREKIENQIPVKKMGDADDLASLAAWLLSPLSGFVTGQLYAVDGGMVKSTF